MLNLLATIACIVCLTNTVLEAITYGVTEKCLLWLILFFVIFKWKQS
ncbi:hypothetical protein KAX08_05570 [candidate division WOR-3 bacterium]|nr:hypothetical protein [candidate division WOR-3 bacterium]